MDGPTPGRRSNSPNEALLSEIEELAGAAALAFDEECENLAAEEPPTKFAATFDASTVPSFNCGAGAACGSIKVAGTNITTLTFKIYVRGDGNGTAWSHTSINAGDEFMVGVTLNVQDTIAGNVFNDVNGLTDNIVNGTGTNLSGSLYVNVVDSSNMVVASAAVASNGTYQIINIGSGTYSLVLSTTQGTQGNAAPAASLPTGWVNTGEHVGAGAGSDGNTNGILPLIISSHSVTNANFGIVQCSSIVAATISTNSIITTACFGA